MPDAHKNFAYSTIASLPAGGSTDNFDRADNNALGGSWTESENFADALRILTNQLRVSNRPVANQLNRGFAVFGSANPADQFAQIVFKAKVGAAVEAEAGPCVRASAAGTHNSFTGYMLLYGGSTPRIRIVKYVAAPLDGGDGFAGTTILGTFTVTLVANDVLKLEVIGTAIKAFVNGVERISVTDAAIATGEPGVVCRTWFSMNPGAEFNSDWDSWETGQAVNTLTVAAGHGARFPAVPFNATVWPAGAQPTVDNAEIIRVTARTTDTLTFSRAQEGTTQRVLVVGDQVAATITALILTDAELGHAIQDEGAAITQRPVMNFAGAGVTVTDAGGKTLVTIPGGGGVSPNILREQASAALTLGAVAADVAGAILTLPDAGTWLVIGAFYFVIVTAGDGQPLGELMADGVTQTGRTTYLGKTTGEEIVGATQLWRIVTTAPNVVVKLRGLRTGTTGQYDIRATHTTIIAMLSGGGGNILRSEAITWQGTTAAISATGEQTFRNGVNDFMRTGFAIPTDYASGVLTYKVFLRAGGGFGGVRLSRDRYRLRSGFDFLQQEAGILSTLVFADTAIDSAEAIYTFTVPAVDFAAGDLVLFDLTRLGTDAADVNPSTILVDGVIVEYLATR